MASYAAPSDLLARYDARVIGDLAGDSGARIAVGSIPTNANVLVALEDASGDIDAALLKGKRYTAANLVALTGNSLAHLKRMCCQIAIAKLWERRVYMDADEEQGAEQAAKQAREAIRKLQTGEEIFELELVVEAGLPKLSTPSPTRIAQRNLLVDELRGNGYFPPRRVSGSVE